MKIAMAKYSKALEEQRMASADRELYLEREMAQMAESSLETLEKMDNLWQARIDSLNEDYKKLAANALTDEKMLEAMQTAFAEERKLYLANRAEESKRYTEQFQFVQKMLTSHIENTLATTVNLHEALKDIRYRLRHMSKQLTLQLKNESKLIE